MRKCGFWDCNNWVKWKEFVCEKCWKREENYRCDACCEEKEYHFFSCHSLGITIQNVVGQTENMLQRTRKMFAKLPLSLHSLLKEIEQSLILTAKEKQAIIKKQSFWDNFVTEKTWIQRRDNIHLIKLCEKCAKELAKEDKKFSETNLDIKNIAKKWEKNQKNHLRILKEIEKEIGWERYKKVQEELEENIKEEQLWVENNKNAIGNKQNKEINKNQEKELFVKKLFFGIIAYLIIMIALAILTYLIAKKRKFKKSDYKQIVRQKKSVSKKNKPFGVV